MAKTLSQTDAITRLIAAGFTSDQARVLTEVIWEYKGGGFEPASAMFLEQTLGRYHRNTVIAVAIIAALLAGVVKFIP
jgi:hypothetical protein